MNIEKEIIKKTIIIKIIILKILKFSMLLILTNDIMEDFFYNTGKRINNGLVRLHHSVLEFTTEIL